MMTGRATSRLSGWRGAVHEDREAALASTAAGDVRLQRVGADSWRVVNAAVAWDDPSMLLGFVQRVGTSLECTLLADLDAAQSAPDIDAARAFFVHACAQERGDA